MGYIEKIINESIAILQSIHISFVDLILIALVILIAKIVIILLHRAMGRIGSARHLTDGAQQAVVQILKYIVWLIAAIGILQIVGVNITLLIASSAALLIGIGFAMQQIMSSIMSGITLLLEGSIRVGDVLKVDGEVVRVTHIGLRTSKVISRDDIVSIIPNSELVSHTITNWSHEKEATRFRLTVVVSYTTDTDFAIQLLEESALESEVTLTERPPEGRLLDFTDNGIRLELLFYSRENFRIERALSDIRRSILRKFRKHSIEMPFPQRVVHYSRLS